MKHSDTNYKNTDGHLNKDLLDLLQQADCWASIVTKDYGTYLTFRCYWDPDVRDKEFVYKITEKQRTALTSQNGSTTNAGRHAWDTLRDILRPDLATPKDPRRSFPDYENAMSLYQATNNGVNTGGIGVGGHDAYGHDILSVHPDNGAYKPGEAVPYNYRIKMGSSPKLSRKETAETIAAQAVVTPAEYQPKEYKAQRSEVMETLRPTTPDLLNFIGAIDTHGMKVGILCEDGQVHSLISRDSEGQECIDPAVINQLKLEGVDLTPLTVESLSPAAIQGTQSPDQGVTTPEQGESVSVALTPEQTFRARLNKLIDIIPEDDLRLRSQFSKDPEVDIDHAISREAVRKIYADNALSVDEVERRLKELNNAMAGYYEGTVTRETIESIDPVFFPLTNLGKDAANATLLAHDTTELQKQAASRAYVTESKQETEMARPTFIPFVDDSKNVFWNYDDSGLAATTKRGKAERAWYMDCKDGREVSVSNIHTIKHGFTAYDAATNQTIQLTEKEYKELLKDNPANLQLTDTGQYTYYVVATINGEVREQQIKEKEYKKFNDLSSTAKLDYFAKLSKDVKIEDRQVGRTARIGEGYNWSFIADGTALLAAVAENKAFYRGIKDGEQVEVGNICVLKAKDGSYALNVVIVDPDGEHQDEELTVKISEKDAEKFARLNDLERLNFVADKCGDRLAVKDKVGNSVDKEQFDCQKVDLSTLKIEATEVKEHFKISVKIDGTEYCHEITRAQLEEARKDEASAQKVFFNIFKEVKDPNKRSLGERALTWAATGTGVLLGVLRSMVEAANIGIVDSCAPQVHDAFIADRHGNVYGAHGYAGRV